MKTFAILGCAALTMLVGTAPWFPGVADDLDVVPRYSGESGFDRGDCEDQCRRRFGLNPYVLQYRDGGRLRFQLFARCMQDCNRRFWRDFDRESEDDLSVHTRP
jgi:hypothetical protein